MPTDPQELLNASACLFCTIQSTEAQKAVELVLWCHLLHETPPPETAAGLMQEATCLFCNLRGTEYDAAVLAILVALANGDRSLLCTPAELAAAARCYVNCIPPGMIEAVKVGLLCRIVDSGFFYRLRLVTEEDQGILTEEGETLVTEDTPPGATNPAISGSATTLLSLASCWWCQVPTGLLPYVELALLLAAFDSEYGLGCDPTYWMDRARSLYGRVPFGYLWLLFLYLLQGVSGLATIPDTARITEENDLRLTEEGDVRITE